MFHRPAGKQQSSEAFWIGLATLVALYLFFLPFLPPVRKFHVIGDIEGYHYPFLNYAFKALQQGRFPLWDPTLYCGLSYVGNIQAQLFYPFTWVLFAAQWYRQGITFMAVQIYAFAHLWILLQLAYWWFRSGRQLPIAASLLGAFTFALTGYVLNDLQHLGVICGLTWFPLAFWGVDRRRFWMIALAGALAFLAGYPATWIAMCVAVFFYAIFTAWRYTMAAGLAMLFSLPLAGIQLLPTLELSKLRQPEPVYFVGPPLEWHWWRFYPGAQTEGQYLYYGAAFLLAILLGAWNWRRNGKSLLAPLGLAAVGWIFLQNSFELVSIWAYRFPPLPDVMQHWNFNAILTAAAACLVATAWTPLANTHPRLVLALLPLFWLEQFWFGTQRQFFRDPSHHDRFFRNDIRIGKSEFQGLDRSVYDRMIGDRGYRLIFDGNAYATDLRHYSMTVPNGFDPFTTVPFRREVEQYTAFETNRVFRIDVSNEKMLQGFGVRYVVASEDSPSYAKLTSLPFFAKVEPPSPFFKVFEYRNAKPAFRFENGEVAILRWTPEIHEFRIKAHTAGSFGLLEQKLPGWHATINGKETPIETYSHAFQKLTIDAPGEHVIRFEYKPASLRIGGIVTLISWGVLLVLAWRRL
jgi:hypothetical protein